MDSIFKSDYMPHGHCYQWDPYILWLNVGSDGLITLSYLSIPITLLYFANKRHDFRFRRIFIMFAAFILGCGLTHAMGIYTVWNGTYGLHGMLKAITAFFSVLTAVMLVPLAPKVLALRSPDELEAANRALERANRALEQEVQERTNIEATLRESERRFRQIADSIHEGFWILSADGTQVLYASPACDRILGRSVHQGSWVDLIHAEDKSRFLEDLSDFNAQKEFNGEYRIMREPQTITWVRVKAFSIQDTKGNTYRVAGTLEDVTEEHLLTEKLSHQARHDDLTGLINRYEFERLLEAAIHQAHTHNTQHVLAFIDLDQFKVINDTCGHAAGDALLQQISDRFLSRLRKVDTLARLGGDEFAILFKDCDLNEATSISHNLRSLLEDQRFVWDGKSFSTGASFGVVPINRDTSSVCTLLSAADAACYTAKEEGRNRVVVLAEPEQPDERRNEMGWISRIQDAIQENRFKLAVQPIIALSTEQDRDHFEILVRMIDEDGSLIMPNAFLPAAERYNISPRIDRWVIHQTLNWLRETPAIVSKTRTCSINLSAHSITDPQFIPFVEEELKRYKIPSAMICFEITETAAISNMDKAATAISQLRKLGCRIALDDFGSGLTSFSYLKYLEVDFIKIDGLFIRDIVNDPVDYAMVRSINDVGQMMKIKTIAEFVETKEILELLKAIGVDYVQGHAVGKTRLLDFDCVWDKAI